MKLLLQLKRIPLLLCCLFPLSSLLAAPYDAAHRPDAPFSATSDILVLRNGNRVIGKVLNDEIVLQTQSGEVRIPKQAIASVEFAEVSSAKIPDSQGNASSSPPFDAATLGLGANALVWIEPGEFLMGSPYDEAERDRDESPQTQVVFTNGFWIGRFEVTQKEYQRVVGTNPSTNTESEDRPVEKLNWYEAMDYCARLTRMSHEAGLLPGNYQFRLPTEAEWEYACRAGTRTRFSHGPDEAGSELREYGWFSRNSDSSTQPVGKKKPNPWGIHDMHGNVWEWCLDRWEGALPGGTITNSPASVSGILRVARGGSWLYDPRACRSANRDDYSPGNRCADLGFRIVLAPVAP